MKVKEMWWWGEVQQAMGKKKRAFKEWKKGQSDRRVAYERYKECKKEE